MIFLAWTNRIKLKEKYINREIRFRVKSKKDSLEQKYQRLRDIILQAKQLKSNNR